MMVLNYIKSGNGPALIILHGLFGMLDNWKTVARELEKSFTVYLVDQRNHGKSPHVAEHSYKFMANDLVEFYEQHQLAKAHVAGHSMGGKTAMQFAVDHPGLVDKLVVVDMGIKPYPAGHDALFDALHQVDLSKVTTRKDAENQLEKTVPDKITRQFVLKNLSRNTDGSYSWKFNLSALDANYETEILKGIETNTPFPGFAAFIRGERSNYITGDDWDQIKEVFPNAKLFTIKDAGHWVHADQPTEFVRVMNSILID